MTAIDDLRALVPEGTDPPPDVPPAIFPGGEISRINDSAVIDFPHPDSPTNPSSSPSSI